MAQSTKLACSLDQQHRATYGLSIVASRLSSTSTASPQMQAAEEKYNKSKMVHSIMRHVAETTGQDLEQLYTQIGWPLYKMYGHAFEAFKQMVQDPEPIFARLQVCTIIQVQYNMQFCSAPVCLVC